MELRRRELAKALSLAVRARRLRRISIDPDVDVDVVGFDDLPRADQQTWLDVADSCLEVLHSFGSAQRLSELCRDWHFYATTVRDEEERKSWHRCLIVEMEVELSKLRQQCDR